MSRHDPDALADAKAALRRQAFAARAEAHRAGAGAALAACGQFMSAGLARGARVASGYRPIRTEIDPTPLMTALNGEGLTLSVPVIKAAGQPLKFREWAPGAAMVVGPFGAEVPAGGAWVEPDLLIVPLVAFDATGARLGYGGGFYDRTLARLRARGPVRAVGLAYAAQEVERVPTDSSDQRLDLIVTERGLVGPAARAAGEARA